MRTELQTKLQHMTTLMERWKKRTYRQRAIIIQKEEELNSLRDFSLKNSRKRPGNYGGHFYCFLIVSVYTVENKIGVIEHWTISHSSAANITPSLQPTHSDAFLNNTP